MDRPTTDLSGTNFPASKQQVTGKSTTAPARRQSASSLDTDSDSDILDRPEISIFVEGELSDQDPDITVADLDQSFSEEQTYRETMRGIRSYMGWSHIPDMDTVISSAEDNPFAGPKLQPAGKCLHAL